MNQPDLTFLVDHPTGTNYEEVVVDDFRLAVLKSEGYWLAIALDVPGMFAQDDVRQAAIRRAVEYLSRSAAS